MEKLRTLIVDDEKPARLRLRELLEKYQDIDLLGECSDGEDAVHQIRELHPDLLFLDIQMPGMDGFDVLKEIGNLNMPVTIFVTAFDNHAIKAFEANALDYLLKPYSDERFERSLSRAISHARTQQRDIFNSHLLNLLEQTKSIEPTPTEPTPGYYDRLVIKAGGRVIFLPVDEIDWIEAEGVYVQIHAGDNNWLHSISLSELEMRLDPQQFIRIHRSTIINLEKVKELQHHSHGDYLVIMNDGTEIKLSRSYRTKFEERLKQSL